MTSNAHHKHALIAHINDVLEEKMSVLQDRIVNIEESKNDDTKSSAGDKFETGREMMQAELDKIQGQLSILHTSYKQLHGIKDNPDSKQVEFGSLVTTNNGTYFISIGLGKVTIEEQTYYAISLASPIGRLLQHKYSGDKVVFQQRDIHIIKVAN